MKKHLFWMAAVSMAFTAARASAEVAKAKIMVPRPLNEAKTDAKNATELKDLEGTVTFEDTENGLKISARLKGVPPGDHGFHIHQFGSCEDLAKAAGGHYNPTASQHGQITKDGISHSHIGDLGNITADKNGDATLDAVVPNLTLSSGKYNVAGRTVILHEKADDFGQPTGNAGGRIGCGTIKLVEKLEF